MFAFEWAYLRQFGIGIEFVEISPAQVALTTIVCGAVLFVYSLVADFIASRRSLTVVLIAIIMGWIIDRLSPDAAEFSLFTTITLTCFLLLVFNSCADRFKARTKTEGTRLSAFRSRQGLSYWIAIASFLFVASSAAVGSLSASYRTHFYVLKMVCGQTLPVVRKYGELLLLKALPEQDVVSANSLFVLKADKPEGHEVIRMSVPEILNIQKINCSSG